jgi:hypothetical protein
MTMSNAPPTAKSAVIAAYEVAYAEAQSTSDAKAAVATIYAAKADAADKKE